MEGYRGCKDYVDIDIFHGDYDSFQRYLKSVGGKQDKHKHFWMSVYHPNVSHVDETEKMITLVNMEKEAHERDETINIFEPHQFYRQKRELF